MHDMILNMILNSSSDGYWFSNQKQEGGQFKGVENLIMHKYLALIGFSLITHGLNASSS